MKYKLVSPKGVVIRAQTTRFETVQIPSSTGGQSSETAPVLMIGPALLTSLRKSEALASSIVISESEAGSIGIVYVSAGGELAALVVDLGEQEVVAWVARAKASGVVSLLFSCEDSAGLLRLPLNEQFDGLAVTTSLFPIQAEQLQSVLTVVVELFDDDALQARYRELTLKDVTTASVSLVVPPECDGRGQALH